MLCVSQLFIYPIKSLGGIELKTVQVTDRGFKYDRRWMLVDSNNCFLSQREFAQLALLKVNITTQGLQVKHALSNKQIDIPFEPQTTERAQVTIWDDICTAQYVSNMADEWFTEVLSYPCRLVYMPDDAERVVDPEAKYVSERKITSFSDAYPFLMIGQASMDDLNSRLDNKISIDRFRPNIVFTGSEPYAEDTMSRFTIGNIQFTGSKLCARCNIPTINQQTGIAAKQPILTLAKYRRRNNKVYFGQNLVHSGEGCINVGDAITMIETKEMLNSLALA